MTVSAANMAAVAIFEVGSRTAIYHSSASRSLTGATEENNLGSVASEQ